MPRIALVLIVPVLAAAQGLDAFNRGVAQYNAGQFKEAAATLAPVAEGSDGELRPKAQFYEASALQKGGYPAAGMIGLAEIIKTTGHPFRQEAVQAIVEAQKQLRDPFLIPTALANSYDPAWKSLPPEAAGRLAYLVALTRQRENKVDEARELLLSVTPQSSIYAKAKYLLGVVDVDARLKDGPRNDEALASFREVLSLSGDQEDLATVKQLARLGVGRVQYATEHYRDAVATYDSVPRYSKYWDQALFEDAFARFRDADYGGALGALQALHAPQFEASFQPESWLLKATIYHFSCLYDESKASLRAFEKIYVPMADQLGPLVEGDVTDYSSFIELAKAPSPKVPRPIYLWVRNNERIRGVLSLIDELDREKTAAANEPSWRGTRLAVDLPGDLEQNRATLVQAAGKLVRNRLTEARQNIRKYRSDGDLIVFQTTLAQGKLYENGVDQQKLLADQHIYRPPMPSEEWNYWQFEGEFWIDEIGYYQYTLKRGCPDTLE